MSKGGRPCGDMPGNEDATLGTVCREESIVKARTEHIHNNLGLNYMHFGFLKANQGDALLHYHVCDHGTLCPSIEDTNVPNDEIVTIHGN
jgi:hypothetical protein